MSGTQLVKTSSTEFSVSLHSVDLLNNLPGSVQEEDEKLTKSAQVRVLVPFSQQIGSTEDSFKLNKLSKMKKLPRLPPINFRNSEISIFRSQETANLSNNAIVKENRIKYAFWLTLLGLLTIIAVCSIAILLILIKSESESKPVLKCNLRILFLFSLKI